MWDRAFLKQNAKSVLKTNYWMAFAVCLVAGILAGGGGSSGSSASQASQNFSGGTGSNSWGNINSEINNLVSYIGLAVVISIVVMVVLLAIGYSVFVANPILVGEKRYFVQSRKQVSKFTLLFSSFQKNAYLGAVKTMIVRDIFLFLWTLLLIIPGIIKGYAYSMVPYILADNPNIGVSRAIELSNNMTHGEKLNIFVLDLSFLGWILLTVVTCGIGMLFLAPYMEATKAELYAALKDKAYRGGLCTPAELGENYPQMPNDGYSM